MTIPRAPVRTSEGQQAGSLPVPPAHPRTRARGRIATRPAINPYAAAAASPAHTGARQFASLIDELHARADPPFEFPVSTQRALTLAYPWGRTRRVREPNSMPVGACVRPGVA